VTPQLRGNQGWYREKTSRPCCVIYLRHRDGKFFVKLPCSLNRHQPTRTGDRHAIQRRVAQCSRPSRLGRGHHEQVQSTMPNLLRASQRARHGARSLEAHRRRGRKARVPRVVCARWRTGYGEEPAGNASASCAQLQDGAPGDQC